MGYLRMSSRTVRGGDFPYFSALSQRSSLVISASSGGRGGEVVHHGLVCEVVHHGLVCEVENTDMCTLHCSNPSSTMGEDNTQPIR